MTNMDMQSNNPITIRRAGRDDVADIIAMLADDHLGRARERLEEPLPAIYFEAFEVIARDPNIELMVAEEAGRVVGCLQLCILPGLSSQGASRGLIEDVRVGPSNGRAREPARSSNYSPITPASMRSGSMSGSDLLAAMSA
jgi:hypothetical protein